MRSQTHRGLLIGLIVAGLLGLAVFLAGWQAAFPEAGVVVNVDVDAARALAETQLRAAGQDPTEYDSALVFGVDPVLAAYLDRNLERPAIRDTLQAGVAVWQWVGRWFNPQQIEELRLGLDPTDGRLITYQHIVAEDAPGAHLTSAEAEKAATAFLARQGLNPADYELTARSSERQAARTDHRFVWQRRDFRLSSAIYQIELRLQGDQVGYFTRGLIVPESFTRDFENSQQLGTLVSLVSMLALLALIVSSLVLAARLLRRDALPWQFGLPFGVALLVVTALNRFNGLRPEWYNYPTNLTPAVYLGLTLLGPVVIGALLGGLVWISASVGEGVRRELWPDSSPSAGLFASLRAAAVPGYALAGAYLGFMTIFYVVGRRYLGVWTPSRMGPADTLSAALPAVAPLLAALQAVLLEEVGLRLFAIPVLTKCLRSTFAAIVLTAFAWSLLHATQLVLPVWVRIAELTLVGCAFGYVFVRFGLAAACLAHFTVDVVLLSLPLLTAAQPYYVASGLFAVGVALLPMAFALAAWLRHARPVPAQWRRHVAP